MIRKSWHALVALSALLMLTPAAFAQKNTGPKYDIANEVKIKGTVEDIREVPGEFQGTHLVIKTDTGTVLVRLAPADFLKEMDASFNKGDQVVVTGAKAPDSTEEVILAREIVVGNNDMTLRDDKGVPVWVGWKAPK
ncbi:MAG TPA: hypothetical protein VMD76_09420 [Candidatus Sulfotelmatobacter sp.]|nr:hypothetical protein [Candidatus Sulfotelmatobacter sp.]